MRIGHEYLKQLCLFLLFCLIAFAATEARADLSVKQARKAITRMAGFELPNGDVKVTTIANTGTTTAEATALIRVAFRFEKDSQSRWRVAEIRTGSNNWEEISLVAQALGTTIDLNECNAAEPPARASAVEPSVKRARCLLGSLFGIHVPSDAIRIQGVAPFAIPLASQPSTTVVGWVQVDARLANEGKAGWQVKELRTGDRDWINLEALTSAMNKTKREVALMEITEVARAMERFRQERGTYIVGESHAAVIDNLSPRYLQRVIRLDPWHQPYLYKGQTDRYSFLSAGPDRKEGTGDDIGTAHTVP